MLERESHQNLKITFKDPYLDHMTNQYLLMEME